MGSLQLETIWEFPMHSFSRMMDEPSLLKHSSIHSHEQEGRKGGVQGVDNNLPILAIKKREHMCERKERQKWERNIHYVFQEKLSKKVVKHDY